MIRIDKILDKARSEFCMSSQKHSGRLRSLCTSLLIPKKTSNLEKAWFDLMASLLGVISDYPSSQLDSNH